MEVDIYRTALERIMEASGRLAFYSIASDALKAGEAIRAESDPSQMWAHDPDAVRRLYRLCIGDILCTRDQPQRLVAATGQGRG